ncbi:MAG: DUF285 domain-containing protein [Opitutae bacterium]|nr:DUF285 domain-containing protein [Opitutae bacterium]
MFNNASSLSASNKGKIQKTFSSNANWPYDWVEFVTYESITDANFQDALNLWFSDEANATYTYGNISDWNVTGVTNMTDAFRNRVNFDDNISGWDVSNVTNMHGMFEGASSFNQPLGDWNVSSVTNMDHVFSDATVFNQPIESWDISSATKMGFMFQNATNFNQDIGQWNTSAVRGMKGMLRRASSFNQDISDWNISSVTDLHGMFWFVDSLSNVNKGLIHGSFSSNSKWTNDWRQHVVIDDSNFQTAVNLWFSNQVDANKTFGHISDWNVSAVTNMQGAFENRATFNDDIGDWDVSNITNMGEMFRGAGAFNIDISDWNTSSVSHFANLFKNANSFNQPIGIWDVSTAHNMAQTFAGASSFNQDVSDWNVSSINNMFAMFSGTANLSVANKGKIHKSFSSSTKWPYDWRQYVVINDANFQTAVNLWFSDEANAIATYGHISDWNTSAVTDMSSAFKDRTIFNENINAWDVSKVTTMHGMFRNASSFNQSLNDWNTSSVSNMAQMFWGAVVFNQSIGDWNTTAVTTMMHMFRHARAFNQDIGDWDTSNITNMGFMFTSARLFNQAIGAWDFSSVSTMEHMFREAYALSSANKGLIHESFSSNPNWSYDWRDYVLIDDSNFQTAVNLWFDNQAEANATYGHISDWNVSAVTNMSEAFKDRNTFNEDISAWDVSSVNSMARMFHGASAFNQPIGNWDISTVTSLQGMFNQASTFNQPIGDWNVSSVSLFAGMFSGADAFNQDIGDWNTSSATHMDYMFYLTKTFNQNIGGWEVSSVVKLNGMFWGAKVFDQDLSDWNITSASNLTGFFNIHSTPSGTNKGLIHESFSSNPNWNIDWQEFVALDDSNFQTAVNLWFDNQAEANATYGHISDWKVSAVTDMANTFRGRTNFNENINSWDVSSVTNMAHMFSEAITFNQPIGSWNTSSVISMARMFRKAAAFNQPIGDWNVSSVENMAAMFAESVFNQPIGEWNVSSVSDMALMFNRNSFFNQPIDNWNVSSVNSMNGMFIGSAFNQNISSWDVSSVNNLNAMFWGTPFNQPIGDWNVSSVRNMSSIFRTATKFNQDISQWNVLTDTNMTGMFYNTPSLSSINKGKIHSSFSSNSNWPYDWSAFVEDSPTQSNPVFPISDSNYTKAFPEHWGNPPQNQTRDFVPFPGGYGMGSGTIAKWIQENLDRDKMNNASVPTNPVIDKNSTTPSPSTQVYILIVETSEEKYSEKKSYSLGGEVLFNGGSSIHETGIVISQNILLKNAIRIPSKLDRNTTKFRISFSDFQPDKTYYFKAYAINSAGENRGSVKKFKTAPKNDSTSWYKDAESLPGGWKRSAWLGAFRPTEQTWIYHAELGWLYPSPMADGSLWFWNQTDGWRWTQNGVFPYFFRWRDSSWVYFQGRYKGRAIFFNYTTKSFE